MEKRLLKMASLVYERENCIAEVRGSNLVEYTRQLPTLSSKREDHFFSSKSSMLSEVINIAAALIGDKKEFFFIKRQVLSSKKSREMKNWFNSPMCVLEIFDLLLPSCCFQSRGMKATTQWGDAILSLSQTIVKQRHLSNAVGQNDQNVFF